MLAINVNNRYGDLDKILSLEKPLETRSGNVSTYYHLVGLRIALVKTGCKGEPDNGCVVGYATVKNLQIMDTEELKQDLAYWSRLSTDSPYWANNVSLWLGDVECCEPKKIKVLPSKYYHIP